MRLFFFRAKSTCDLATYPVPPASSYLLNTTSANLKEFEHAVFSCQPGANLDNETRSDVVSGKVGRHSTIDGGIVIVVIINLTIINTAGQ